MIPQTIAQKQVQRTLRAIEEKDRYQVRLVTIAGMQCAFVNKLDQHGAPVTGYTVRFRRAGVPVCNCPDKQRPEHRHSSLCCKHAILAMKALTEGARQ